MVGMKDSCISTVKELTIENWIEMEDISAIVSQYIWGSRNTCRTPRIPEAN